MPRLARYYLGRVIKLGQIGDDELLQAIRAPVNIRRGEFVYTFTDISEQRDPDGIRYVYAHLAKYKPQGLINVVEPDQHIARPADVPNLLVASSPFVYIPSFSGLAYQHIWNKLQREQFERLFGELITEKFEGFFAQCTVQPISDLRTFVQKVSRLDRVSRIEAAVHPPNPLFGPAWKGLRDYIRRRNLAEVRVVENAADYDGVTTNIPQIAAEVLDKEELDQDRLAELLGPAEGGIGDSAVLMAADGYGKARVEGIRAGKRITLRTQESQVNFSFDFEPTPLELYERARAVFERIDEERYLEHL